MRGDVALHFSMQRQEIGIPNEAQRKRIMTKMLKMKVIKSGVNPINVRNLFLHCPKVYKYTLGVKIQKAS